MRTVRIYQCLACEFEFTDLRMDETFGHMGGAPAEKTLYSRVRSEDAARQMWEVSQELVGVRFPKV